MSEEGVIPVTALEVGKKATVIALAGGQAFQSRIISMGLNTGREVEVVHRNRGCGPILIASGETRLAIGYGMAEKIMVAADPSA